MRLASSLRPRRPTRDGPAAACASARLVRPTREISEASIIVHGIRAADLARAPRLGDAIGALLRVTTGQIPVVQAAAVERASLGRALKEQGARLWRPIVDTEALGCRRLRERGHRPRRRLGLGELASALGLPADRPHNALSDSLTTAQAFIALATHLDASHARRSAAWRTCTGIANRSASSMRDSVRS